MSRNASGTYTLPSGNPVVAGTLIEASWANTTLSDLATAMTDSLSRSGQGGMTAALRLFDGTSSVPGLAWGSETTTGWYRAGAGDMRLVVTGSEVMKYLSTGVTVTGTFGVSGAVTLSSTLAVTGATTFTANPTLSAGTANGVAYLNGSKVVTTGSALTFDGVQLGVSGGTGLLRLNASSSDYNVVRLAVAGTNYGSFGVDTGGAFVVNANGLHLWNVNSSEQMRLNTTQLGLGTSTNRLGEKLHVLGNGIVTSSAENTNMGMFGTFGSANLVIGAFNNLPVEFRQNNTERMRFPTTGGVQAATTISVGSATPATSGGGITFPATQQASSDANTLDDYEEGSFSSTVTYSTTLTATPPTSTLTITGYYTKIGNVVTCTFPDISKTSTFSATSVIISNFTVPFASANNGTWASNVVGFYNIEGQYGGSITNTNVTYLVQLAPNSTSISAVAQTTNLGGGGYFRLVDTSASLRFSITYRTA